MDKIYSRKRFLLPKLKRIRRRGTNRKKFLKKGPGGFIENLGHFEHNKENNDIESIKRKRLIKIFLIIVIAVWIANKIITTIEPTMYILCSDMAKSIATKISNEQATAVMQNYKYENISRIIRDEQENVKMIQMDIFTVNAITSEIALKIQEELDNYQSGKLCIKLGTFTGSKLLSGRGPNVPIKMSTVGNVETNLVSSFSHSGINQTLHRIYLDVSCNVVILTPYDTIEEKITNQVLLAEAVIVGNVPDTYYNLNDVSSEDLMELVE